MHRYRVHIVPRTGRFAPLLTVLVEADSPDQAIQIAQIRCSSSKAISAESVGGGMVGRPQLGLVAEPAPADVDWKPWDVVATA
jgi:hypothetical protein